MRKEDQGGPTGNSTIKPEPWCGLITETKNPPPAVKPEDAAVQLTHGCTPGDTSCLLPPSAPASGC